MKTGKRLGTEIIHCYNRDEYVRIDGQSDQGISTYDLNAKVLSKDLLPQKKPLDVKAYIINTDNSDKPGVNWMALYFKDDKFIFFS